MKVIQMLGDNDAAEDWHNNAAENWTRSALCGTASENPSLS
jgi:hypothetical protein